VYTSYLYFGTFVGCVYIATYVPGTLWSSPLI